MPPRRPPEERFWEKVDKNGPMHPTLGRCWVWIRAKRHGYGAFGLTPRRIVQAHRFSYELVVGPIPPEFQVDHLCNNHACVRPSHLEPVTPKENTRRATWNGFRANAAKTHCKRGHELSGKNVRVRLQPYARICRTCDGWTGLQPQAA